LYNLFFKMYFCDDDDKLRYENEVQLVYSPFRATPNNAAVKTVSPGLGLITIFYVGIKPIIIHCY